MNKLNRESKEKSAAWKMANQIQGIIQMWLAQHDKKNMRVRYKPIDQLRLLRLQVWSIRYKLEVKEILSLLMPVLRGQKKQWKKNIGLGLSIQILTSDTAERILTEEIQKKYPDNEHILLWKEKERERQIQAEEDDAMEGMPARKKTIKPVLQYESPHAFVSAYNKIVAAKRQKNQAVFQQSWRKRRNYRGNPWR